MLGRGRGGDLPEAGQRIETTSSSSDDGSGSQERSSSSSNITDNVIRGRGGYRQNLVTIPSNVSATRNESIPPECQSVDLLTNYIGIKPMGDKTVFQYRFDFEPQVESQRLRRALVFKNTETQLFNGQLNFDGMSDGRSTTVLKENPTTLTASTDDGQEIKISIKKVGIVDMGAFEMLRLYNTDMKRFLRELHFFQVARGTYVHPQLSTPVQGQGINIIRGYNTAANLHDNKNILMNLEAVHKLMQDKSVLMMMNNVATEARRNKTNLQEAVRAEFINKLVVTKFNKKCYKIEEVNFEMNPTSTFDMNGAQVSFIDYFRSKYNEILADRTSPLLLVRSSNALRNREAGDERTTYLPPEICFLAGLATSQANDFRLKNELVKTCQLDPKVHVEMMKTFLNKFHLNDNIKKILDRWSYSYEKEPKKVKGIILPNESICWDPSKQSSAWPKIERHSGDFESHLKREKLAVKPNFQRMLVLCLGSCRQNLDQIMIAIQEGFQKTGLLLANKPITSKLEDDRPSSVANALRSAPRDAQLILVIVQKQNKGIYDAIKKACSIETGIPTQVVTAQLLTNPKKARGAAVKIAVQIAAKVGGEPWHINLPIKNAMFCGYDTYHDTSTRGRSFGAFIASTNSKYSKWFSKVRSHDKLEELSTNLAEDLADSIKNWKALNNNELPQRVFMFRDGVGDSQIEHVFKVELKQAKAQLRKFTGKDVAPIKLTVIIVNKRVGARFFVDNRNQPCTNPIPGTVVDNTITREGRYDFYLVSQSTRQGTITPTYYNVIYDESGLRPDKIQMIAFKMCLNYYNWTGGVRVPAPCQYAHKLAFQTGENTHAVPNSRLCNSLHFL